MSRETADTIFVQNLTVRPHTLLGVTGVMGVILVIVEGRDLDGHPARKQLVFKPPDTGLFAKLIAGIVGCLPDEHGAVLVGLLEEFADTLPPSGEQT